MPKTASHVITIQKKAERKLNPGKITEQVKHVVGRVLDSGRADRGWTCDYNPLDPRYLGGQYIYSYNLTLNLQAGREREQASIDSEFQSIVKIIRDAGRSASAGKWVVTEIDDNRNAAAAINDDKPIVAATQVRSESDYMGGEGQKVDYAPVSIPRDWRTNFSHIYDREAQIDVIKGYLDAAVRTNFTHRFHAALVGEPAGGKTETARGFKKMLGDQAVFEMDATSTTMAGAIKTLNQSRRDHMVPRVLIIEEIEKADFKQYPWLLAVLDPRAEIRKINAREKIHMQAQMFCIATINNFKLFRTALEGALASRFAEPIFFPRPSPETLRKILLRDVRAMGGKESWIEPAIKYSLDQKISDPRHILAVCLAGGDALVGGSYQKTLAKTRIPAEYYDKY